MKNLRFLVLLFLAVSLGSSSCKKNDDEVMASIVGKWGIVKTVEVDYVGTAKGPTETETTFSANDFVEFKSDGTAIFSEEGDTDAATYTVNTDTKKMSVKLNGTSTSIQMDIRTLNSTDLVLYAEESTSQGGITYKFTIETSFKKK